MIAGEHAANESPAGHTGCLEIINEFGIVDIAVAITL